MENMENMLLKCAPQRFIIGKPISQYASYSAMFCPLHSNIGKEQHKKHLCNPSSHYGNYGEYTCETCPHISIHESHNISISAMSNSTYTVVSKTRKVPHQSLCLTLKPFYVYHKLSPYTVVKKRMGDQRRTKVAPWCKHCSSCGWWKGTSQDEATLISEEIKSLAPAILKLCLSEGISKSVSRKMR